MRILHTIPGRNWGGMEQRTLEQVRWLATHGHDVWLAAPADGEPYRAALAEGLPLVSMNFDRPWRPATVMALRRLVTTNRIDIIDTHVTRDAKAAIELAALFYLAIVGSHQALSRPVSPPQVKEFLKDIIATYLIHRQTPPPGKTRAYSKAK